MSEGDERWEKPRTALALTIANPKWGQWLLMRRRNLNKQTWAAPSHGRVRHLIGKESPVPADAPLTGTGYGNERQPRGMDHPVPSSRDRMGALMNILLSMCLGLIVLTLALLVFWVLSQFDPLR